MASRIIDVDYYAGGDRKVVTSVDVYKSIRALQLEGVTSQRAAAKILGIDDRTGTLEVGKDANIVISEGDILDMKSSIITNAFIQGRGISLQSKHTQLFERYKHKYGIK